MRERIEQDIVVEYSDGLFIASLEAVNTFVSASTKEEAIEMLLEEVNVLHKALKEDEDNLGPMPKQWLDYLEGINH
jgi:hypothetical protein